jgi:hypothetical protein
MPDQKKFEVEPTFPCIRDDGYVCMGNNVAIEASMGRLRPYHGKIDATLPERMAYLQGLARISPTSPNQLAIEMGLLDVDKMSRTDLIQYAWEEFGIKLIPKTSLEEARLAVKDAKIASLTPLPTAHGIGAIEEAEA